MRSKPESEKRGKRQEAKGKRQEAREKGIGSKRQIEN